VDIGTIIGLIMCVVLIIGSIFVGGGSLSTFIDIPSVLVVGGGSVAAALICFPLGPVFGSFKVMLKVFLNKVEDVRTIITQIVALAETARRDGLLALESKMEEVKHPFIRMGIQLAIDGSPPEVIEDLLRTEVDSIATRHGEGKAVMDQLGRFAPAYGMIGTLLGLVMMLSNMSDPSSIGAGMAVALLTTLYGAVASNCAFIPFAEKLAYYNKKELLAREIIIRGILAIQSGENPRVIQQKLSAFLPPKQRVQEAA